MLLKLQQTASNLSKHLLNKQKLRMMILSHRANILPAKYMFKNYCQYLSRKQEG